MAKVKTSTNELVSNILGDKKPTNTNSVKDTSSKNEKLIYNNYDKKNFDERKKVKKEVNEKPQCISIVIPKETYEKLQEITLHEKLNGNRTFSISNLGRNLIENWVKENYRNNF